MSKDTSIERDVVKEGEAVKRQILTDNEPAKQRYKYEFTLPVEFHIPGFTLTDTIPSTVEYYTPDFYYINRLLGLALQEIRSDSTVKRLVNFTDFSYSLYVNYVLLYILMKKCYALHRRDDSIRLAIETFEVAGYDQAVLPQIALPWVTAIGKYIFPDRSRTIVPRFPPIATFGISYDCFFWSESASQLLPNFRAILAKCRLMCKRGNIGALADRNVAHYRNVALLGGQAVLPPNLVRANDAWIPGSSFLVNEHTDLELIRLSGIAMSNEYPNAVSRYLQLHVDLLTHVAKAISPGILLGPHFSASTSTSVGSASQIVVLHERADLSEVIPTAGEGLPPLPRYRPEDICFSQLHAHQAIIDGDVYNNTVTPQVRIIPEEFQFFLDAGEPRNTETEWIRKQKKFQSTPFTFEEATTNFRMKRLD